MSNRSLGMILASAKMAIATMLSRVLGLVREQVVAFTFGAGGLTDAFIVAYRVPNILRELFAEGAFSSAFIPTFTELNQKNKEQARKLLWSVFILLVLITGGLVGLICIFAPELVSFMAPSFSEDPEKFLITVKLIRLMSPFLTLISVAAIFMGALNTYKIFFIPAVAPAVFNIAMISCALG